MNSKKAIFILFMLSICHSFLFIWLRLEVGALKILNSIFLITSITLLIIFSFRLLIKKGVRLRIFTIPYILIILWSLITIQRSFSIDLHDWMVIFGNYILGGGAWLTPLALLIGYHLKFWNKLFQTFLFSLLISVLLIPFYFISSIYLAKAAMFVLFFSCPLFVFMMPFLKYKYKVLLFLSLFSYFIAGYIYGSRTVMLVAVISLCFVIFENLRSGNIRNKIKHSFLGLLVLSAIIIIINTQALSVNSPNYQELTQDTRTFLLIELFEDLSTNEQIVGRGTLGEYYSETFDSLIRNNEGIGDSKRGGVEIGYLNMLLKGGFVMIVLFLIILIPISLIGIFNSKNFITRSLGYYILLTLLLMTVNFPQAYDPMFILLWLSAGSILNKKSRKMSNEEIIIYLHLMNSPLIFKLPKKISYKISK